MPKIATAAPEVDKKAALTPLQFAEQMGWTRKYVYDLLLTKRIPGAKKDKFGQWKIPAGAIAKMRLAAAKRNGRKD